jgi:hypothetical protein
MDRVCSTPLVLSNLESMNARSLIKSIVMPSASSEPKTKLRPETSERHRSTVSKSLSVHTITRAPSGPHTFKSGTPPAAHLTGP